ncbi:MAG TPA: hypothetical protein GXX65_07945 [Methanosarcina sp.]|nr:hypothetical protein [Methanosarcina sp.]
MGEEEVTLTFHFYEEEISVKVDPALLDAVEQDMKLYGLTFEEILSVGYKKFLDKIPEDKLLNMDFNEFGIEFPAVEYDQEMSIEEFLEIESNNSEIIHKQIELLKRQKNNLDFRIFVLEKSKSAHEKRLAWERKHQKQ